MEISHRSLEIIKSETVATTKVVAVSLFLSLFNQRLIIKIYNDRDYSMHIVRSQSFSIPLYWLCESAIITTTLLPSARRGPRHMPS